MLAGGVAVALGTDSLASASSLDLMEDVALLHAEFPSVAAADLVHCATLGGARALGLSDLGSIEPGKRAALAFASSATTPADPLEFLVSGARLAPVAS
jgi:cytosine/adenosine deaminase-related metal-dependent hydrolase